MYIIHDTSIYDMILMHRWLPSVHHTQDGTCIVSSIYKHYTGGARRAIGHEVPSQQVNARMCNVVEAAEIGAGGFINESPTCFTPHDRPNVS